MQTRLKYVQNVLDRVIEQIHQVIGFEFYKKVGEISTDYQQHGYTTVEPFEIRYSKIVNFMSITVVPQMGYLDVKSLEEEIEDQVFSALNNMVPIGEPGKAVFPTEVNDLFGYKYTYSKSGNGMVVEGTHPLTGNSIKNYYYYAKGRGWNKTYAQHPSVKSITNPELPKKPEIPHKIIIKVSTYKTSELSVSGNTLIIPPAILDSANHYLSVNILEQSDRIVKLEYVQLDKYEIKHRMYTAKLGKGRKVIDLTFEKIDDPTWWGHEYKNHLVFGPVKHPFNKNLHDRFVDAKYAGEYVWITDNYTFVKIYDRWLPMELKKFDNHILKELLPPEVYTEYQLYKSL